MAARADLASAVSSHKNRGERSGGRELGLKQLELGWMGCHGFTMVNKKKTSEEG